MGHHTEHDVRQDRIDMWCGVVLSSLAVCKRYVLDVVLLFGPVRVVLVVLLLAVLRRDSLMYHPTSRGCDYTI